METRSRSCAHLAAITSLATLGLLAGCVSDETSASGNASDAGPGADGGGAGGPSSGADAGPNPTGASPVVLGDPLTAIPTNVFRCTDGYPIQINPQFPQPFYAAGASSCTVLTFLAPTGPSPGSGTAVSAAIRVGETTGPMRFVRMRILFQNGTGPKCCSVQQYGDTFTPTAGTTTTVPLGFPMTEESVPPPTDTTTTIANDLVALEVLTPTTPIPGYWPANGGAVQGNANYVWLPSLTEAKIQAPSVLLNYSGSYSGFVPSFQLSYVPNR